MKQENLSILHAWVGILSVFFTFHCISYKELKKLIKDKGIGGALKKQLGLGMIGG